MKERRKSAQDSSHEIEGSTILNNCFLDIKNYPFDVPSSMPGCYGMYGDPGEYKGIDGCVVCELRLNCARMSAGDD